MARSPYIQYSISVNLPFKINIYCVHFLSDLAVEWSAFPGIETLTIHAI